MNWYVECLKKYAVFSGRAHRTEYWTFGLVSALFYLALAAVEIAVGPASKVNESVIASIYATGVLIPTLAVTVRRLHDIDLSGWWLLVCMIPLIGILFLFVLMLRGGHSGENRFGPNPAIALDTTATSIKTGGRKEFSNLIQRAMLRVVGFLVIFGSALPLIYLSGLGRSLRIEKDLVTLAGAVAGLCIGVGVVLLKRWARNLCVLLLIGLLILVGSDAALWKAISRFPLYAIPALAILLFCLYLIQVLAFANLEDRSSAGTRQSPKNKKRRGRPRRR